MTPAALDGLAVSAGVQLREMRGNLLLVVLGVIQPAVFLAVALLPQADPDAAESARVAGGALLTAFWGSTVWNGAGVLRRERAQGTLPALLTGVRDARLVLLGKSFGATLASVATSTVTVAVTMALLRLPVAFPAPGAALAGAVLLLASGAAAGLLLGSLFVLTRYGPQLSNVLMYPVFLLGGMLVPLDLLPEPLRWASWLISTRWAQACLTGEGSAAGALGMLALLTAGYGAAGVLLFRRVVDLARTDGSLELL